MADQFLFSGEPLPLAPSTDDPELENFHRKLLDYLRRLTEKVSAPETYGGPSSGVLEAFASGLSANQNCADSTAWTDIGWTDPWRRDAAFAHDATTDPDEITLVQSGFYLLHMDISIDNASDIQLRLANGDGDGLAYSLLDNTAQLTRVMVTYTVPFFAAAGGIIRVQIKVGTNNDDVEADYTRLAILRIGSLGGTGSVPGVDPEDDPWWKYTL
ncbi:MAG: hypothetical protein ACXAEN_25700 [Candidatus Thorarchaeota archaeon]|jgi:hypothetical protein